MRVKVETWSYPGKVIMQTTTPRGLDSRSHNSDDDLLKRFAVILDGHPENKPSGGLWMATRNTAEEARIKAEALALSFPTRHVHIFDSVSGDWEPINL